MKMFKTAFIFLVLFIFMVYNETCMDFVYRLYLWMVCVILFVAHH